MQIPLNDTHLDVVRRAYLTKRIQAVHQQQQLVGAMLLRSSRINGSSSMLCQGLDLILKLVVTLAFHS